MPQGHFGEFLLDVMFVAVARPEHPLFAVGHEVTYEDLARHVQVVVRDSGVKHPRDEGWLGAERRCTVSSMEASLATVKAGLAYAWLPEHVVAESLRNGTLAVLPLVSGKERRVPLYLVSVQAEVAGPAARAAVECFQRHIPLMAARGG
jgi:DNA-binding transcriptional LysR family regulator